MSTLGIASQIGLVVLVWVGFTATGWVVARAWGAGPTIACFAGLPVAWSVIGAGAWLQPDSGRPSFGIPYAVCCLVVATVTGLVARGLWRRVVPPPPSPTRLEQHVPPPLAVLVLLSTLLTCCVVVLAAAGWTLETASQTWDATYHTNAAQYAATTGIVNPDVVQRFVSADTGYYPTGVLSVTTLVVSSFGVDAVVATNVIAILLAGALWPGCVVLGTVLAGFGSRRATIVAAGVLAVAPWGMPWAPLGWGVLWPTAAAAAYGPVVLGLTIRVLRHPREVARWVGVVAWAVIASLLMHPRGLALILLPPLVVLSWWLATTALRHWRRGQRSSAIVMTLGGGVAALTLAVWSRRMSGAKFAAIDWPRDESFLGAVGSHLVAAPQHTLPSLALTLLLPLGLWVAWKHPRLRWLAATWCALVVIDALTSAVRIDIFRAVTRFWYQDRFRSAAMTAFPAILLATVAVNAWWPPVVRRFGAAVPRIGAAAAVVSLVCAALPAIGYLGDRYDTAAQTPGRSLVSREEATFLRSVREFVPDSDLVLNNPADGSTFLYAYAGVRPVFYTMARGSTVPEATMLLDGFNNLTTIEATCAALRKTQIRWVLDGGPSYSDRGIEPTPPTGLSIPAGFPLTTLIAATPSGGMRLYRITGCRLDPSSAPGLPAAP